MALGQRNVPRSPQTLAWWIHLKAKTPMTVTLTLVLLSPFLTACSQDNRVADVKQCIAKAQYEAAHGQLPYLLAADSAEQRHDKMGGEIADCMAMEGYKHGNAAMADERCVDDVDFNPYCYKRA